MNKKLTILVALVLAVVLTGYSVSGTYAKYITKETVATDTATAALWYFSTDYNATQNIDLFKSSYTTSTENPKMAGAASIADPAKDIVAPGTHGTYTAKIAGTSEVNYKISFEVDEDTYKNNVYVADETGSIYSPLLFKVKFNDDVLTKSYSEEKYYMNLKDALKGLSDITEAHNPGTFTGEVTIEWFWAFDEEEYNEKTTGYTIVADSKWDDEMTISYATSNSDLDTKIGNGIYESIGVNDQDFQVSLDVKVIAEQVR